MMEELDALLAQVDSRDSLPARIAAGTITSRS
jgi:hypothetical protein